MCNRNSSDWAPVTWSQDDDDWWLALLWVSGRVARAGRGGTSYSLVCPDEVPYVYDLHLFLGRPVQLAVPEHTQGNINITSAHGSTDNQFICDRIHVQCLLKIIISVWNMPFQFLIHQKMNCCCSLSLDWILKSFILFNISLSWSVHECEMFLFF